MDFDNTESELYWRRGRVMEIDKKEELMKCLEYLNQYLKDRGYDIFSDEKLVMTMFEGLEIYSKT